MDQAPPKVSLKPPTSSSKPPKSSLFDPKLKPPSSASSPKGNNQKGKTIFVWIEKQASSESSASPSFSSRPPPSPSPLELPQSLEPSLSASSSKLKRRNRHKRDKNLSVEKVLPTYPSSASLEPQLVIYSPPPPLSPSSSESPPLSPKLPSASSHSYISHQHVKKNYLWIEKGSSNPSPSSLPSALVSISVPPQSSHSEHSSFSSGSPPSSPKLPPTLRQVFSSSPLSHVGDRQGKSYYSVVQKNSLPIYKVPKYIRALIKKDIVPKVLYQPLSPLTYKNYFAALLYAEEVYLEKWKDYQMLNVTLSLEKAIIKVKKKKGKIFVMLELDSIPERRPFLLSRDFVYARPSGTDVQPYEGILYRVVRGNHVLVDFGHEFHYQHDAKHRYDISFSFNRICFKRAHAAILAASYPLFQNYLFPDCVPEKTIIPTKGSSSVQKDAVRQILGRSGSPPYIIQGQVCVYYVRKTECNTYELSNTGEVVRKAALEIYRSSPDDRILICAPLNSTCDGLMISLKNVIPERDMYRTNAAFREVNKVPVEILLACNHDGDCFPCPPLAQLKGFRLIFSTFVTSFRLQSEGLTCGHFSHIFLLDAALATEPETMIPLANFANESTAVIVTGATNHQPNQLRSGMARTKGLKISYFERLSKMTMKCDDT